MFLILITGSIIYFSSFAPTAGQRTLAKPGKDLIKRAKANDFILQHLNFIIPDLVNRAMYIRADSQADLAALHLGLKVQSENLILLEGMGSMMAGNGPFMSFKKMNGDVLRTTLEYVIFTSEQNKSKDLLWYRTWGGSWPIIKPEYLNQEFNVSYVPDFCVGCIPIAKQGTRRKNNKNDFN